MLTIEPGDASIVPLAEQPACIVHVVNDLGIWGQGANARGFTRSLNANFPEAREFYAAWARGERMTHTPGTGFGAGGWRLQRLAPELCLAHLVGQLGLPSRQNTRPFNLGAFSKAFQGLVTYLRPLPPIRLVMPPVGTGYGGENWDTVQKIIQEIAPDFRISVRTRPNL